LTRRSRRSRWSRRCQGEINEREALGPKSIPEGPASTLDDYLTHDGLRVMNPYLEPKNRTEIHEYVSERLNPKGTWVFGK
jgi:hypothetical protein